MNVVPFELSSVNLTLAIVRDALLHVKATTYSPDNIPGIFIRNLAFLLTIPVFKLFNMSLQSGTFPSLWKFADVTPLYKGKGSKCDANNYRPISCTAVLGKLLECIVKNELLNYISLHQLFSTAQHGFRPLRSVVSNLLIADALVSNHVDAGHPVDIILFDMSKAFDVVSHDFLAHKLLNLGIKGNLLTWIISFLHNRFQRVRIGDVFSTALEVLSGVIQGSVLGPILFVLFINDIVDQIIFSKALLYADDLKLLMPLINIDSNANLQCDINNLSAWMIKWRMSFNAHKCYVIHVGPNNPRHVYTLNGFPIPVRAECLDLGVLRDESFTYTKHIESTVAKCHRLCACILHSFASRNRRVLTYAYMSYIRPILDFASSVWSPKSA